MDNELMWSLVACSGLGGLLLGTIWGRVQTNWYWRSKGPDKHGFRTGVYSNGQIYYVVTGDEYVDKILKP